MRLLRAFVVALLTAIVGCVLAFFVGDCLTRLAHVPEMEGQRGMTVIFLCVPLGILASLVIGIISSILVGRRQGLAGFVIAQGWSLLIVCGLAGLLVRVPYVLSDKPPRIDGKQLELQFELRAPQRFKFQTSPMVTAFESALTPTISKVVLLSSIGARLRKMPNTSPFQETSRDLHIATQRADLSSVPEPERFAARYRVRTAD